MMRWFCALVFAVAAGSSVLAGSGLAVPPHVDPTGTPGFHDHLLAAYRYPLFLLRLRMLGEHRGDPSWTIEEPGQVQLGAMVFATLVFFIPKLPRPTRRAVAVIDAPAIRSAQWRLGAPLGPPRLSLLAIA